MSLLFIGDLHLGRRPAGLDEAFTEAGLDPRQLSPAAAWRLAVEHAIEIRARAVVLAGDVVDADRDRFEAYHALERGVADLLADGIAVFGVAGNHDGLVLPRLADRIEGFRLLGGGGVWECAAVPGAGPAVDLLGWSFPRSVHREDPLAHASLSPALEMRQPAASLIGVVHGDVGQRNSRYAPLATEALQRAPADAWFLGHIHRPDDLTGVRPIGYLGSLVGLDIGEPGPHGTWHVEVEAGQVRATLVPLALIRWEHVDVDLGDGVGDADDVHARVQEAVARAVDDPAGADPRLTCVVARARLTGRLEDRSPVREFVDRQSSAADRLQLDGRPGILESIVDETRTAVDLAAIAAERTPAGRVARRLLELESGAADDLVARAGETLRPLTTGKFALSADDEPLDPRALIHEAAWTALDRLLEHRSGEEQA